MQIPREPPDERSSVLEELESWVDKPMLFLGLVWLALLVIELAWGLTPLLEATATIIWLLFISEFLLRLWLAENRLAFIRKNWLTALSLLIPALRALRAIRLVGLLRVAPGIRVVRVVASVNRTMNGLGAVMARRGLGYVVVLTLFVTLAGGAGMYALERDVSHPRGLHDFGTALWWTAMLLTTMGSEYWPVTAEGRVLCLLLATYGFAVFGYVTAALASYFIDKDANEARALRASVRDRDPAPVTPDERSET